MKHVKLPIYDGDIQTTDHLEVSVEILERLAATSVIFKDHVKVVPMTPAEVEMDMVNRIISGLPPRVGYVDPIQFQADADTQKLFPESGNLWDFLHKMDRPQPSAHFTLEKDGTITENVKPEEIRHGRLESISFVSEEEGIGQVTLVDVVSKHPDPESWRTIPKFESYGMMPDRTIIDKETQQEVPLVDKGKQTKRNASVLLYHNDGGLSHMNVAWLFRQTYPELND